MVLLAFSDILSLIDTLVCVIFEIEAINVVYGDLFVKFCFDCFNLAKLRFALLYEDIIPFDVMLFA